jgi:hypothetical protein
MRAGHGGTACLKNPGILAAQPAALRNSLFSKGFFENCRGAVIALTQAIGAA